MLRVFVFDFMCTIKIYINTKHYVSTNGYSAMEEQSLLTNNKNFHRISRTDRMLESESNK
jgi:hypothetical protein